MELPSELFGIIAQFIPDHKTLVNLSLTSKVIYADISDDLSGEVKLGNNVFQVNRRGIIVKAKCDNLPISNRMYSFCDDHRMNITFLDKKVIKFSFVIFERYCGAGISIYGSCNPENGNITEFSAHDSSAWISFKYHFPSGSGKYTITSGLYTEVDPDNLVMFTPVKKCHQDWLRIALELITELNKGRLDEIYRRVKQIAGGKEEKISRCLLM